MRFKNILICSLLFCVGAVAGKKAHKWQENRERELKVPHLPSEFTGVRETPERDVYVFLHMFNYEQAICRSLSTFAKQEYGKLRLYLLDENSTDGTWEKAHKYIEEKSLPIEQSVRGDRKELCAFVEEVLQEAPRDSLIVPFEGKNWLPHEYVVQLLNHKIAQNNCQLLLGQLSTYPQYKLGLQRRWIKIQIDKHKWPKSLSFPSVFKAFDLSLYQQLPHIDIFNLNEEAHLKPLYEKAGEKTFFSKSVYYVDNRLEPGKKLLFSEGE